MAPLAFNMLFDILIAAFAISYGAAGLSGVADYYGWNWGNLAVRVLSGIGLGMGLIFG